MPHDRVSVSGAGCRMELGIGLRVGDEGEVGVRQGDSEGLNCCAGGGEKATPCCGAAHPNTDVCHPDWSLARVLTL